jgi:hypothetical protein
MKSLIVVVSLVISLVSGSEYGVLDAYSSQSDIFEG